MKSKTPKHRDTFQTKAALRDRVNVQYRMMTELRADVHALRNDLQCARITNKQYHQKILSDAFLIDELKKQIAQQHVQLCNMRENTRDFEAAKTLKARAGMGQWLAGEDVVDKLVTT